MTNKLLLHPDTQVALREMAISPAHAILLTGPAGIGKSTLARFLAAQILGIPTEKLPSYTPLLIIEPVDGKAISIEAVRQLEHFIALRTTSQQAISRIVIIDNAQLLSIEAQNSLLKTLEEPPRDTVLILTSPDAAMLLPTIRSRIQTIDVLPPSINDLEKRLTDVPSAARKQITALSGGLPGLAFALAYNDQNHPLVEAAGIARQLLQMSTFERLTLVDKLTKNKLQASDTLQILMRMAHSALLSGKASERWQKVMAASYAASEALAVNTQPKLVLTNLMLNL